MLTALIGAATLVVAPGTALATIGEALATAPAGARIVVRQGIYEETGLRVDRPVEIVGEGRPTIDAGGQSSGLVVASPGVSIRGLAIRNTGRTAIEDRAGIRLEGADGCVITDNHIDDTYFGIYLAGTQGCRVADNVITGTNESESLSGNAIHLWNSHDTTILRNRPTGHRDGIYLEFSNHAHIEGNQSTGNLRYGLHFMVSNDAEYRQNVFAGNGAGVAVMYSTRVAMTGNTFENNRGQAAYGLVLKDITDSRIADNTFRDNTVALFIEGSSRLDVSNNLVAHNGWAVRLMANAEDNRFRGNTFAHNTFDVATNGRQHTSRFEGNHWDRYDGYDLDGDGEGDVPFSPVRLFAYLVARNGTSLVLQRSLFVDILDTVERVLPVLSPQTLVDQRPLMRARH